MKNPMERQLNLMDIYLHKNRAEQSIEHLRKSLKELSHQLRQHEDKAYMLEIQGAESDLQHIEILLVDIDNKYKPF